MYQQAQQKVADTKFYTMLVFILSLLHADVFGMAFATLLYLGARGDLDRWIWWKRLVNLFYVFGVVYLLMELITMFLSLIFIMTSDIAPGFLGLIIPLTFITGSCLWFTYESYHMYRQLYKDSEINMAATPAQLPPMAPQYQPAGVANGYPLLQGYKGN